MHWKLFATIFATTVVAYLIIRWLRESLNAPQVVSTLSRSQFQDLCLRIHVVRDHAKHVRSITLVLPQDMHKLRQDDRLFATCFEDEKKVPNMAVTTPGEMVGWAMLNDFPPRNGRTSP